jgi:hypothetical protein
MKGIEERWFTRVVTNGWDKQGSTGALAYLAKYGKQISNDKLQALADYAYRQGSFEFGAELMKHKKPVPLPAGFTEFTQSQAEAAGFNDDSIDQYVDGKSDGREVRLVETNIAHLAMCRAGHGCAGNNRYGRMAKKYPAIRVRGCLDTTADDETSTAYELGCVDMELIPIGTGTAMTPPMSADDIGQEIGDSVGLRFEDGCPKNGNWYYFEDE